MSDLYATLHITTAATAAEIKAAHRARAKETHPDHGGSPDEFHAVQTAYEVLSDPGRRARYDGTGEFEEATAEPSELSEVAGVIQGMMKQVLAQVDLRKPIYQDIVAAMIAAGEEGVRKLEREMREMRTDADTIRAFAQRFSTDGTDNVLRGMVEAEIPNLERGIEAHAVRIALHRKAVDLLRRHSFRRDAAPVNPWAGLSQADLMCMMSTQQAALGSLGNMLGT